MLLLFDIRNSSIAIALADVKNDSDSYSYAPPPRSGIFSPEHFRTVDDCLLFFSNLPAFFQIERAEIKSAAICSVVPALTEPIYEALSVCYGVTPFVIRPGIRSMLKIKIDNPAELGSDILVNSVAAATLGSLPTIVIDLGAAITISAVTKASEIIGTAICPGLGISSQALRNAAPQILFQEIRDTLSSEKTPLLGRNTNDSVKSGMLRGCGYLLNGFVSDISETFFPGEAPNIYLSGSFPKNLTSYLNFQHRHVPALTSIGLLQLYKINCTR